MSERIAIIAALQREVAPVVRECGFTGSGKSRFWNRLGFWNRLEGARLQPRRKKFSVLSFRAGFSPRGICFFDFFRSLFSRVEAHGFSRVEAHGFSRVKRAGEGDGALAPDVKGLVDWFRSNGYV